MRRTINLRLAGKDYGQSLQMNPQREARVEGVEVESNIGDKHVSGLTPLSNIRMRPRTDQHQSQVQPLGSINRVAAGYAMR